MQWGDKSFRWQFVRAPTERPHVNEWNLSDIGLQNFWLQNFENTLKAVLRCHSDQLVAFALIVTVPDLAFPHIHLVSLSSFIILMELYIFHQTRSNFILFFFFKCVLWIQQMLFAVCGGETYVVQWKQFCTWGCTDWHPNPNSSRWCYLSGLIDSSVHSLCMTWGKKSLQTCWGGQRWQPTMTVGAIFR